MKSLIVLLISLLFSVKTFASLDDSRSTESSEGLVQVVFELVEENMAQHYREESEESEESEEAEEERLVLRNPSIRRCLFPGKLNSGESRNGRNRVEEEEGRFIEINCSPTEPIENFYKDLPRPDLSFLYKSTVKMPSAKRRIRK